MTKQHKSHHVKRMKPSLRTHGHRRHRRVGRLHRAHFRGDSGFGAALSHLTDIGHARGY